MKNFFLALLLISVSLDIFAVDFKKPWDNTFVHDYAGNIKGNPLGIKLKHFKKRTSVQIDVLTIDQRDLEEYDVSEYAIEIAKQWRVVDDRILMVVKDDARHYDDIFIYVGSNLKKKIPDDAIKKIIYFVMMPHISLSVETNNSHHHYCGIDAGIDALCNIISPEPIPNLTVAYLEKPWHNRLVHDEAGILTSTELITLDKLLKELKDKTIQIDVLTIKDLKGHSIDYYANQIAEQWGIEGDRILVVVKKNQGRVFAKYVNGKFVEGKASDTDFFIVVGSNFKATLTDDIIKNIRQSVLKSHFINEEYIEGLGMCIDSITTIIRPIRISIIYYIIGGILLIACFTYGICFKRNKVRNKAQILVKKDIRSITNVQIEERIRKIKKILNSTVE